MRIEALALLGYAMAEDRLFQMDLLRRRAAGRVAELFGPPAVAWDRRARTLCFAAVAKEAALLLPARQRALLEAFARGVNARIDELPADSFPFSLLGYRPESWTAADSLGIELLLCDLLSTEIDSKRCRTVMAQTLPPELHAVLASECDPFTLPLVGRGEPPQPIPDILLQRLAAAGGCRPGPEALVPGFPESTPGSNAWAIGPSVSGGAALVANDLHLGLTAPGLLFPFAYDLPDETAAGVGVPGLPCLLSGRNRNVAWGLTNFCGDTLDLVLLTTAAAHPDSYLTADGPRRFRHRPNSIRVRGGADVCLDVRQTIWGPVLEDTLLGRDVACRWTALEARHVDASLLDIETCGTTEELLRVARAAGGPPLNVLAADSGGRIGWCVAGRFPRRTGDAHLVALEGTILAPVQTEVVAPDNLPQLTGPAEGMLVSANHRIVTREGERQLGQNFGSGFRCRRISDVLARGSHGVKDALSLQLDADPGFYDFYAQLGAAALAAAGATLAEEARDAEASLRDLLARRRIASGLHIATGLRDRLMREILSLLLAPCRAAYPQFHFSWKNVEAPLRSLLAQRPAWAFPFSHQYAHWDAYIAALVLEARAAGARPGPSQIPSPLAPLLPELRSRMELPGEIHNGTRYSVRIGASSNGAVARLVSIPGQPVALQLVGGVSEDPDSPHYRDAHELWRAGRAVAFPSAT